MKVRPLFSVLTVLSLVAAGTLVADEGTTFFRNPALSATTIVFEYGGDLWTVPRSGGQAARLTTGPGEETNPVFSPDGSMVAFSGRYDGNVDVFVVPSSGGVPKRLTWHPGPDALQGWTPDGKRVLFSSGRSAAPAGYQQLFTIGLDGGAEQRLPLPIGYEGAFSPDGARIAYVPLQRAFTMWKRYRGGRTTPIWLADLATSRIERVPRDNSNDYRPMWAAGKVWFLSDREGPVTLFSYDPGTKRVARAVENRGMDFKSASAASDAIVIEQFGRSAHLRSQVGPARGAEHQRIGRSRRGARALRQGWHAPDQRLDFAKRSPRGVRGARRDHHGAGGERGRAQPHQHARRDRARPGVVARRRAAWRISRTSPASTRCTSRRRTAGAHARKIALGNGESSIYVRPDGRPTAGRSRTSTRTSRSGTWTWTRASR